MRVGAMPTFMDINLVLLLQANNHNLISFYQQQNSKTLLWTPRANGPPLAYHTACYLSKFDVIAVFGGQSTDFQAQDVLITYSVSQGVWNQIVQPVSNKPR